ASVYSSSAAADEVGVVQSLVQHFNEGAAGIPAYNQLLDVMRLKIFSIHDGRPRDGMDAQNFLNDLMRQGAQFKLNGPPRAQGHVVVGKACWIDFDHTPNDNLA